MRCIKKNLKNNKSLEVDELVVNESITGSFSISPTNVLSSPLNSVTVNQYSKLIPLQGAIVDTNTVDQTIQAHKNFAEGLSVPLNKKISWRNDFPSSTSFIHAIAYDTNSAGLMLATSDDSTTRTSIACGYRVGNLLAGSSVYKSNLSYTNAVDSTQLDYEGNRFLTMNSAAGNKFNLTNLNSATFGSSTSLPGTININKSANAEVYITSQNNTSGVYIGGQDSEIEIGNNFRIHNSQANPEDFNFYKNPTVTFMKYNSTSGCLGIGDNLGGTGLTYANLNMSNENKIMLLPRMNNSQAVTFATSASGSTYQGSLYYNTQANKLCFLDSNNVIHNIGGTINISGTETDNLVETLTNKTIAFASNTLIDVVSTNTTQNISGQKTFTNNTIIETSLNNNDPLRIKCTTGSIVGLSLENSFSADKIKINKNNDDLSFVNANIERMRLTGNDLDLTNGGRYRINTTDIKDVSETLTNKTISFAQNTLTNVVSTNSVQTISSRKVLSNTNPLELTHPTESKITYDGGSVDYSLAFNSTSGVIIRDESISNNLLTATNNSFDVRSTNGITYNSNNINVAKVNTTTTNPGVGNDNTQGYSINSLWFNTTTKSQWVCKDASTGAAIWRNNNRQDDTFSYFFTTSDSYQPIYYKMAGGYSYNSIRVIAFTAGASGKVELYNVSTASVICEVNLDPGGPALSTAVIPSAPQVYASDVTLRVSAKANTSGDNITIFCVSFE